MQRASGFLDKAKKAYKESKHIEFKEAFDIDSDRDWCEIVKDIVALANSGGGCILVGVCNDGTPSQFDINTIDSFDLADFVDKIYKYTARQFSAIEITRIQRRGAEAVALLIQCSDTPLVFEKPGIYHNIGEERTAFRAGTIYFRHGAKSEPGNNDDLRESVEREIIRIRKSWLGNMRKLVKAPSGSVVHILAPSTIVSDDLEATPMRVTDDLRAPLVRYKTADADHQLLQKDVIGLVNKRLQGKKLINSYDILCVRRVYQIDETKPQYYYKSTYGSKQYSQAFVNWLVDSYIKDPLFFDKAREAYGRQL